MVGVTGSIPVAPTIFPQRDQWFTKGGLRVAFVVSEWGRHDDGTQLEAKFLAFNDLESRKHLSFAQAEGAAPLPSQLKRTELPQVLRAKLWEVLHSRLQKSSHYSVGTQCISPQWEKVLRDEYINRSGNFGHTFTSSFRDQTAKLSDFFRKSNYIDLYDFLQYILRTNDVPANLHYEINAILEYERAAFRIVDGDTFVPVGSDEEFSAVQSALEITSKHRLQGAHAHLRHAAEALTSGKFADSVRESIHAVEAVARTLEPSAELSKALARLESSAGLHNAMKRGFAALYGYTSDEGGIRHPLLEAGDAKVDEADAIFMIGACASFVTYLIAKKRSAGLADV